MEAPTDRYTIPIQRSCSKILREKIKIVIQKANFIAGTADLRAEIPAAIVPKPTNK